MKLELLTPWELPIIENLIMELEIYNVFTPEITSTNTNLKYWEIEDFDTYFQVNHLQTTEPEICE